MKKIFVVSVISFLVYACANQSAKEEKKADTPKEVASTTPSVSDSIRALPEYKKGLEMVAKSDCTTCHRVDEKNVGPSYREIADAYEPTKADLIKLSQKIIKGGQGAWGGVPMTPHPDLSDSDVQQMLKYIFLLKSK